MHAETLRFVMFSIQSGAVQLMLTSDGQVKILDFGLASLVADDVVEEVAQDEDTSTTVAHLTNANTMIGTPTDYGRPTVALPRRKCRADDQGGKTVDPLKAMRDNSGK